MSAVLTLTVKKIFRFFLGCRNRLRQEVRLRELDRRIHGIEHYLIICSLFLPLLPISDSYLARPDTRHASGWRQQWVFNVGTIPEDCQVLCALCACHQHQTLRRMSRPQNPSPRRLFRRINPVRAHYYIKIGHRKWNFTEI